MTSRLGKGKSQTFFPVNDTLGCFVSVHYIFYRQYAYSCTFYIYKQGDHVWNSYHHELKKEGKIRYSNIDRKNINTFVLLVLENETNLLERFSIACDKDPP